MIRISEGSWYAIFLLASSSIQELYQMSLTCKEWYKLIRKEKLLLLFVNLHLKRLLRIWPPPLRFLSSVAYFVVGQEGGVKNIQKEKGNTK